MPANPTINRQFQKGLWESLMPRFVRVNVLVSMVAAFFVLMLVATAPAQDRAADAPPPEVNPAAPGDAGAAPAPAGGPAQPAAETQPKRQSYLSFFFNAL